MRRKEKERRPSPGGHQEKEGVDDHGLTFKGMQ